MAANVYECMFLLDTNKVAGDVPAAAQQLHTLLEKNHCEVLASRPWDERRLSYSVKGHKKGLYYLTYFSTETKNLATLEHDIGLSELILRYLVLHIDKKLVDIMLAVARDEHALALQLVSESEGDGTGGAGDLGYDDRPRRRRDEGPDK
jgi:small subunit ribosomal protein S6